MIAKQCYFDRPEVKFMPGALVGKTDLNDNSFFGLMYISAGSIDMLSKASGGSDNQYFSKIHIWGGSLESGELILRNIGTQQSNGLTYGFVGSFTIGGSAKLRGAPGVKVYLRTNSQLFVFGELTMEQSSTFVFDPRPIVRHVRTQLRSP